MVEAESLFPGSVSRLNCCLLFAPRASAKDMLPVQGPRWSVCSPDRLGQTSYLRNFLKKWSEKRLDTRYLHMFTGPTPSQILQRERNERVHTSYEPACPQRASCLGNSRLVSLTSNCQRILKCTMFLEIASKLLN